MIPALGAGGHEFDSRITPPFAFYFFVCFHHKKKEVEKQGIDPCASCMLSKRSTI
jgi:hypothetical protein